MGRRFLCLQRNSRKLKDKAAVVDDSAPDKTFETDGTEKTAHMDNKESERIPGWFKSYSENQKRQHLELMGKLESQQKKLRRVEKIERLLVPHGSGEAASTGCCPRHLHATTKEEKDNYEEKDKKHDLEQLETGAKTTHILSENHDSGCPRHKVGCTPYECHGALMEKNGFGIVQNKDIIEVETKLHEATSFIKQFAEETGLLADDELFNRLEKVKNDIIYAGTYIHTFEELQFGCRLAWRNSGRCIMRKVSFTLELRDCRNVATAEECYQQCVDHLKYAFNEGAIKPVISVFRPKLDGKSAPVRIWNRQLLGYAAYKRMDGTIMGDPVNLQFTALCENFGWEPPLEKSDFDVLPWLISDEYTGHSNPKVFVIPEDAIEEVKFTHPEFPLFELLNLRWYCLPAISNIGIDIGGVYYQTTPFNGWYQITEIGRDFLDRQRYDLAEAVAMACGIEKSTKSLWRDDAQLQVHKAILHSFAKESISCVDHHSASEAFMDFYKSETEKRGKCPADWVWLVPPAAGSMTSVFHQEMFNFILKPQYRLQANVWDEEGIELPEPIRINDSKTKAPYKKYNKEASLYDHIYVYYGSETGKSLRHAIVITSEFGAENVSGPFALDSLPDFLMNDPRSDKRSLVLIVTSTFGKGHPPANAQNFESKMDDFGAKVQNIDFAVLALGNSAYQKTFVAFAYVVEDILQKAGCKKILTMEIADELKDQGASASSFLKRLLNDQTGAVYFDSSNQSTDIDHTSTSSEQVITASFEGHNSILQAEALKGAQNELNRRLLEKFNESWESHAHKLGRSMDEFTFKVDQEFKDHLDDLTPGDHIAFYPWNMDDVVESVLRNVDVEDKDVAKEQLKHNIDLSRPLGSSEILELNKICQDEAARQVIDLILANCTQATNPSMERLVQILPPGSIPMNWILEFCPNLSPRFYSIVSKSQSMRTVSVCQAVYTFEATKKAGVTSRWMRNLKKGDKARIILAKSDFHLPKDESAPLLFFSSGSGVAPFRSFWLSNQKNPMYNFYGCRDPSELPFKDEIERLEKKGRMHSFVAYSRVKIGKMRIDGMIRKEKAIILELLHNPKTVIYLCGSPEFEISVLNAITMVLADGSDSYPGIGIQGGIEKLVIMSHSQRYLKEIYGVKTGRDIFSVMWEETNKSVVRNMSGLQQLGSPKDRAQTYATEKSVSIGKSFKVMTFVGTTERLDNRLDQLCEDHPFVG